MSNQQAPSRPWFRLASLARPAPTPTPEPTPAPPRPADTVPPAFSPPQSPPTAVSSVPTSPAAVSRASQPSSPSYRKPTSTTSSSVPSNSPTVPKTAATASSMASSPTAVKPAMQSPIKSPKVKLPTAPTPSPLTLPPPQLKAQAEVELKNKIPVEVQKTIDKPKEWLFGAPQKDVAETSNPSIPLNEPYNNGETKEKGHGKDDVGTRVITIAGANKGAFMEIIGSPHNNGFQGSPHRLGKMVDSSRTGSDYQIYSSSDGEGDGKMNNNSNRTSKTKPMNAFMNSNVQGVNNSILYNSSCTHHDPGVHLSLQRKPAAGAGGFHVKERINGYNS
ncbi:hypothetical protein HRI_001263600 [Hibiscus trionum]|uniref:Uncharacterized protein n=1 Tax=Hibiscus trionum TaxID=183268 RepID=A0A9W7HEQ7_HIBTR|nr:hypothetical protein HRI_001263600 [Hibiscus trionum]